MKIFFLLIVLFLFGFLFSSCNDSGTESPPLNNDVFVSGRFENWIPVNAKIFSTISQRNFPFKVKLDSAYIGTDGSFNVKLPNPADSNLESVSYPVSGGECSGNINVNPVNTAYTETVFEIRTGNDSLIGFAEKRNYADSILTGSFNVWYNYYNKDVAITGSQVCRYPTDTSLYSINIICLKGWNKLTEIYDSTRTGYYDIQVSLNEPSGGKWYFYSLAEYLRNKGFTGKSVSQSSKLLPRLMPKAE